MQVYLTYTHAKYPPASPVEDTLYNTVLIFQTCIIGLPMIELSMKVLVSSKFVKSQESEAAGVIYLGHSPYEMKEFTVGVVRTTNYPTNYSVHIYGENKFHMQLNGIPNITQSNDSKERAFMRIFGEVAFAQIQNVYHASDKLVNRCGDLSNERATQPIIEDEVVRVIDVVFKSEEKDFLELLGREATDKELKLLQEMTTPRKHNFFRRW